MWHDLSVCECLSIALVEIVSCPPGHMDARLGVESVLGSVASGRLNPHKFAAIRIATCSYDQGTR